MECINLQEQFGTRYRVTFDPAYASKHVPRDKLAPWTMQISDAERQRLASIGFQQTEPPPTVAAAAVCVVASVWWRGRRTGSERLAAGQCGPEVGV
jgi:hypothetical protein